MTIFIEQEIQLLRQLLANFMHSYDEMTLKPFNIDRFLIF